MCVCVFFIRIIKLGSQLSVKTRYKFHKTHAVTQAWTYMINLYLSDIKENVNLMIGSIWYGSILFSNLIIQHHYWEWVELKKDLLHSTFQRRKKKKKHPFCLFCSLSVFPLGGRSIYRSRFGSVSGGKPSQNFFFFFN